MQAVVPLTLGGSVISSSRKQTEERILFSGEDVGYWVEKTNWYKHSNGHGQTRRGIAFFEKECFYAEMPFAGMIAIDQYVPLGVNENECTTVPSFAPQLEGSRTVYNDLEFQLRQARQQLEKDIKFREEDLKMCLERLESLKANRAEKHNV